MTVEEAIRSHDIEDIVNRMTLYANTLLKGRDIKDLQGKESFDFVQEVLCKSLEGKRNWDDSKCSFVGFLFGCLKSEISNFFASEHIISHDIPDSISKDYVSVEEEVREISALLKQNGADDDEIILFTCWTDGICKPSEASDYLGIKVKDVLNITKRLKRRLQKIQLKIRQLI